VGAYNKFTNKELKTHRKIGSVAKTTISRTVNKWCHSQKELIMLVIR